MTSSCEASLQVHYIDHYQIDKEIVSMAHERKPASEVSIKKCGMIKETLFLLQKYLRIFILQR